MKFKLNNQYVRWGLTAFCVVAASIGFYSLVFHGAIIKAAFDRFIDIMMPVVFGFVLAYLLTPIMNRIDYKMLRPLCDRCNLRETKKRNSVLRGISILITTCLLLALIYGLIAMMVSQIMPSIVNLINNFDTYVNNVTKFVNRKLEDNPEVGEYVTRMLKRYSKELEEWLNNIVFPTTSNLIKTVSLSVISLLHFLWNFIIGFMISIYVLASKERFAGQAKKIAYALFETPTANMVINNFRFTHKTFIGFLSGKILDSFIIGVLCFIGVSILGMPYPALLSVVIGVTNVIPFFGPYLGAIPCTILVFLVDPTHPLTSVYFVIFILVLQQFDGNVLGPKILGNSTGLTGFWVIFAITLFGGLFGVLGMIVGVPIFAVIYAAIKSVVNTALAKKNMPQETKAYLDVGSVDDEGFHEYIPMQKRVRAGKSTVTAESVVQDTPDESDK